MGADCNCCPQYHAGDEVISLVCHPPEIESGTRAVILSQQTGLLYAVQLPNGELHRWFAGTELRAVNRKPNCCLKVGDLANIISVQGHPPMIKRGMVVKIIKVIPQAVFFELKLENGKCHRWLAEWEIACPV